MFNSLSQTFQETSTAKFQQPHQVVNVLENDTSMIPADPPTVGQSCVADCPNIGTDQPDIGIVSQDVETDWLNICSDWQDIGMDSSCLLSYVLRY